MVTHLGSGLLLSCSEELVTHTVTRTKCKHILLSGGSQIEKAADWAIPFLGHSGKGSPGHGEEISGCQGLRAGEGPAAKWQPEGIFLG